jgi:hypothetical protein
MTLGARRLSSLFVAPERRGRGRREGAAWTVESTTTPASRTAAPGVTSDVGMELFRALRKTQEAALAERLGFDF